jgi:hypothetical protein
MSTIKPELIHVISMNVYKASVNTSDEYLDNPTPFENISVAYAQDSAYNIEEKGVRIRLEAILEGHDDDDKPLGLEAEYGIEFHFVVDNIEDFIDEEEDEVEIKGILWGTLMGIAYSTARGIIFDRTQGTFFKGVIIPVIDPKKLVEE